MQTPELPFAPVRRGLLLVVSAPSGGGKSAVLRRLLALEPELAYSVSVTTRPPRPGEVDGRDYHFVSDAQFDELIARGAFYEWASVHGYRYGTRADTVAAALEAGRDVVMDIDVQGAMAVHARTPDAVLVFLVPPSWAVLEQRLRARATETEDQIRRRLDTARAELAQWRRYDYLIINDVLEDAAVRLRAILHAERLRVSRIRGARPAEPDAQA